ncbi:type IV pilin [Halobaculum sp. MBLA0147]|uniref:type IV pilin n=1 Tax=Halobaculum sp. MBLA0147 TaxID=3079934 RepID=UPI003524AC64
MSGSETRWWSIGSLRQWSTGPPRQVVSGVARAVDAVGSRGSLLGVPTHLDGTHDRRGVSPVIATVLLVAVVVVLAATLGGFALGIDEELSEPAPNVASASGELRRNVIDDGGTDQIVRITHEGGDPVAVSGLVIQVTVPKTGQRGRLSGFPVPGDDPQPTEEYVSGDDVFDNSANSVSGSIGAESPDTDDTWNVGDFFQFRIANGAVSLSAGDRVVVTGIHGPSESTLFRLTLTAR